MIQIIWEFRVGEERAEFLRYYSSVGAWAILFRKSPGYKQTILLRDSQDENRYITIDIWESLEFFSKFKKQFSEEYETLDEECEKFAKDERSIGVFQLIET